MRNGRLLAALFAAVCAAPIVGAQSAQYRSPAGVEYRSQPGNDAVARATQALAADPTNADKIIALGTAQAGVRDMRGAIATFTTGIAAHPNNALLYRWRGHRHLSVREFDDAKSDFARGLALDSAVYGIWFHLGIIRFTEGAFSAAADAFKRAQPLAPDPGELAASTDWLWMSLARAGRMAEANSMLARHPDSLKVADPEYGYVKRLRLYRGEVAPERLITATDTADTQAATLNFGLGNWYLVRGDTGRAKAAFERAVQSGGWPAFGFIEAEADLRRLAPPVIVVFETSAGSFDVAVDVGHAPVTAANFLKYVDAGGYNNGFFHRTVRPNTESRTDYPIQVVQASAAKSSAQYPAIPLERTSVTGLRHVAGTISMARGGPDTATSDFYICITDTPENDFGGRRNADGQGFAAFGKITRGMDVIRKIQASPVKPGPDGRNSQSLEPPITILSARRK